MHHLYRKNKPKIVTVGFICTLLLCSSVQSSEPDLPTLPDDFEERVLRVILHRPEIIVAALRLLEEQEASAERGSAFDENDPTRAALFDRTLHGAISQERDPLLIEFSDYRCGYCGVASETVQTFTDEHDKRIRILELPILGEASRKLAKIAIAVRNLEGPFVYYDFHMALIEPDAQPKSVTLARRIAEEMLIDFDRVLRETQNPDIDKELRSNMALARKLGVSGTPAFVSKTRVEAGLQDLQTLNEMVREDDQ